MKHRNYVKGLVIKNNKILLVKEKWNRYSLPGGMVENNESFEEAIVREVFEETGIKTRVVKELCNFVSFLMKNGTPFLKLNVKLFLLDPLNSKLIKAPDIKEVKWVHKDKLPEFDMLKYIRKFFEGKLKDTE